MKSEKLKKLINKIDYFEKRSSIQKIIIQPNIPKQLEELQKYIINSQIEIEKLLSEMIRVKLWAKAYSEKDPWKSLKLLAAVYQVVEYLPYHKKVEILCSLESSFKSLKNRLEKMYKFRNEFAHKELKELLKKYNTNNIDGAQKILHKYQRVEKLRNDLIKVGLEIKDYKDYVEFVEKIEKVVEKQVKKKRGPNS